MMTVHIITDCALNIRPDQSLHTDASVTLHHILVDGLGGDDADGIVLSLYCVQICPIRAHRCHHCHAIFIRNS